MKYISCGKCQKPLENLSDDIHVHLDIERVLSIVMIACEPNGEVLGSRDIIILPEGKHPASGDWCSKFKHKMFVTLLRPAVCLQGTTKILLPNAYFLTPIT